MFGGFGVPELVLIFLLVLLLFGAKKIPGIARGLGEGIRNFKGGLKEGEEKGRLDDPAEGPREDRDR
jgi:sec-independent protein translocase protein TatA